MSDRDKHEYPMPSESPAIWNGLRVSLFFLIVVGSAVAWSFEFMSFLHAKEMVLCLGGGCIAFLYLFHGPRPFGGVCESFFPLLLASGIGLIYLGAQGITAISNPFYAFLRVLLIAIPLLWAGDLLRGRHAVFGLFCIVFAGALVALLGLLQYYGCILNLFPRFPEYDQPAYSVFGNQDFFGGYLAVAAGTATAIAVRGLLGQAAYRCWWIPAFFCLPVLIAGLAVSMSRSAWLAAFIGGLFAIPWREAGRRIRAMRRGYRGLLLIGAGCFILSGAFHVLPAMSARVQQSFSPSDVGFGVRWWLWDGCRMMIRENPWAGVGWGNYGLRSPLYLGKALWAPGGDRHYRNELHADNAHSEPLEFLAENGIGGVLVLAAGIAFFGYRRRRRRQACLPASAVWGGLAALAVFSCFNAAFHSVAHALAGWILLQVGYSMGSKHAEPPAESSEDTAIYGSLPFFLRGALSLTIFFVMILYGTLVLYPSYTLRRAENAHLLRTAETDRLYVSALAAGGACAAQAHMDYGIWLMDKQAYAEASRHFEKAAGPIDTGKVHLLRAICAEAQRKNNAAYHAAWECAWRWPDNRRAWELVLRYAPKEERPLLEKHRARWLAP